MRTAHLLLSAAVAVAVSGLALVAPTQAAPAGVAGPAETNLTSTTRDLGTLGGKRSEATVVDGTIVVGWSQTEVTGDRHAFAYDLAAPEPAMLDLGTLGGRSMAKDVDGTVVVGTYDSGPEDNFRAFAYDLAADEPAMLDLGTLGGGNAIARAVEGTIITGMSQTASGETHAFAYDLAAAEPVMRDLGSLGGGWSDAVAVDGTVVVGGSGTASGEYHAFAYDLAAPETGMLDLGTLGGRGSSGYAVAGNIVTGESDTVSGDYHAFAYDLAAAEPTMQDLGTLGGTDSSPSDVDGTIVVGESYTASGERRAFAYDLAAPEPAMRDLGTVKGGATTRTSATAIDGDIVIGRWEDPRRMGTRPFSFAYDLGADEPSMLDLGTWRGAIVADVDGDVVVGQATYDSGTRATAWVLRNTTRPMIAFQRLEQRVKEGVGRATIRVTRYGRTDRAVTVRYQARVVKPKDWSTYTFTTVSDTAKAGQDFVATSGKLRFPRGVTRRSFTVKILNDRRREGNEYLLLTLSRPSSPALLGTLRWSQLRINANDR